MFRHLREDWPWIVVPMLVVAIVAVIVAISLAPEDDSLFTYGL